MSCASGVRASVVESAFDGSPVSWRQLSACGAEAVRLTWQWFVLIWQLVSSCSRWSPRHRDPVAYIGRGALCTALG